MARNLLLMHPSAESAASAARSGAGSGEVGLVLTDIGLRQEKLSGARIEEERSFGGTTVSALDEPVFIGSAIAQLAGHCDCVIVDRIATWVERLVERFPGDPIEQEAEIKSLVSVLQARMADLILVAGPPPPAAPARALYERALEAVRGDCDERV